MLTHKEIHERLKTRFPDDVLDFVEEKFDPYSKVQPAAIAKVCEFLKTDPELAFNYLVAITSLDQKETLAALYHIESMEPSTGRIRHCVVLKVEIPRDAGSVASITSVWPAADWHERECFDLMGIKFDGHPDLRRILTADDWEGHPLRKDYVFPKSYRGIDLT